MRVTAVFVRTSDLAETMMGDLWENRSRILHYVSTQSYFAILCKRDSTVFDTK